MQSKSLLLLSVLFVTAICWSSCTSDTVQEGPVITGHWEIEDARRNGRLTEGLSELYFTFTDDGTFKTNIDGNDATGKYRLEEGVIYTTEIPFAMDYKVAMLDDSSLHLKSEFRNYRFDLRFKRSIQTEEVN